MRLSVPVIIILIAVCSAFNVWAAAPNRVLSVSARQHEEGTAVSIGLASSPVFSSYRLSDPLRLVVDFPNCVADMGLAIPSKVPLPLSRLQVLPIPEFANALRVVLELDGRVDYDIKRQAAGLEIMIRPLPGESVGTGLVANGDGDYETEQRLNELKTEYDSKNELLEQVETERNEIRAQLESERRVLAANQKELEAKDARLEESRKELSEKQDELARLQAVARRTEEQQKQLDELRKSLSEKEKDIQAQLSERDEQLQRIKQEKEREAAEKAELEASMREIEENKKRQEAEWQQKQAAMQKELVAARAALEAEKQRAAETAAALEAKHKELVRIEQEKADAEKRKQEQARMAAAQTKPVPTPPVAKKPQVAPTKPSPSVVSPRVGQSRSYEVPTQPAPKKKKWDSIQDAVSNLPVKRLKPYLTKPAKVRLIGFRPIEGAARISVDFDSETDVYTKWNGDSELQIIFGPAKVTNRLHLLPLNTESFGTPVKMIRTDWSPIDNTVTLRVTVDRGCRINVVDKTSRFEIDFDDSMP